MRISEITMKTVRIDDNIEANVGDEVTIRLTYPRSSRHKYFLVELADVRCGSLIRLSYDFDRDGWMIEQDKNESDHFEQDINDCIEDWAEVAFIPSWQFETHENREGKG